MSQVIVFLALAFSIVIAIFAVQNTTPVAVTFLTFRADTVAVSVLVLISAALLPQTFLNVPFTTALLTHGTGFLFLLWYIMPRTMFDRKIEAAAS